MLSVVVSACSVYDASLLNGQIAPSVMAAGSAGQQLAPAPAPAPGPVLDASGLTSDAGQAMDPDRPTSPAPKPDASAPPEEVTRCGDGKITGTETCDIAIEQSEPGACPKDCKELERCVPRAVTGTACQATCVLRQPLCENGDGCCPGNCTSQNDKDCSAKCGDKSVDPETETCEPDTETPCKANVSECDDKNACTTDTLIGSVKNCNTSCAYTPVTEAKAGDGCCPMTANANTDSDCKPKCGNNIKEAGEDCDGGAMCDAMCKPTMQTDAQKCLAAAKDACAMCACTSCPEDEAACHMSSNADFNAQCTALIECARKNNCSGSGCLGSNMAPGPCQMEIETAAGTSNILIIGVQLGDLTTPVGRSFSLGNCVAAACPMVCPVN